MKIAKFLAAILAVTFLVSCASRPLTGRMYELRDGTQLEFVIYTSTGNGKMTAKHPKTGEVFEGEYSGNVDNNVTVGNVGGKTFVAVTPPSTANAGGILRGNKGTVIQIWLEIKPGYTPTGHGDGVDQQGNKYQIHF